MVLGAVGAIVMVVFLNLGRRHQLHDLRLWISLLAIFLAIAYAPWMASFTETVEKRNPALTATGLADLGLDHPRGHRHLVPDPSRPWSAR